MLIGKALENGRCDVSFRNQHLRTGKTIDTATYSVAEALQLRLIEEFNPDDAKRLR